MTKSSKPKKKREASYNANIIVDGNVTNSNIVVGYGNTINIETLKTTYGLFTIPQPVTDFTGREEELAQLKASFEKGAIISGLSGSGGIGKTELARKLAHEIADHFPDAQMNIDLLGTSEKPISPEDAMRRLLEPFHAGQKLPDDETQLKGLYQQTFARKKALLLLDNAANVAQARPLIPPAPSAAIITSRQHFSLTEFGMREPLRLDVLSPEKASELLRGASPKLNDASTEEVHQLSKLCGHLPLALRVAASLLNDRADWTLATLLQRLVDERTRLARLKRDNDIDLNVEATISLSYTLLDDDLKNKFRKLGVFTAPFLEISAQAVWGLEDEADDYLGKLCNRSLLNILALSLEEKSLNGYVLHDLTRLFAIQQLLTNEEEIKQATMLHANHFLEWAGEANKLYLKGSEDVLYGLAKFRFVWEHLASAYERLLPEEKGLPRPQEADKWLSEFPLSCAYILEFYLSPHQRIPVLESALNAARRLGDKQREGSHLGNLGIAYSNLGDARKAIKLFEERMKIAQKTGDLYGEGNALGNLGNAYHDLGDTRKAIGYFEQALVIDRKIGNRRGQSAALSNLGDAFTTLGDTQKAIEFYEQTLMIDREIGDLRGEGNSLSNMGNVFLTLGNAPSAIEYYRAALEINRKIGDRHGEAVDLGRLGLAYSILGQLTDAIEFCLQALNLFRETGNRRNEANLISNLGGVYLKLGEANKALNFFKQAMDIEHDIGDRRGEGKSLGNVALAHADLGDKESAIHFTEQALKIFEAIESPDINRARAQLAQLHGEVPLKERVELMNLQDFVQGVIQAHYTKSPQAAQYFNKVNKMMADSSIAPEIQELAKVLRNILAGVKEPDLTDLSEELARLVKEGLENQT